MSFIEHNPISHRIDLMRARWHQYVQPDVQIIRWLVEPDEVQMVEGFFRLESSPHGQLPELFLKLATPFYEEQAYENAMLEEWLHRWETPEGQQELQATGITVQYNAAQYRQALNAGHDAGKILWKALEDFATNISGFDGKLVLFIWPEECAFPKKWASWLQQFLEPGIPPHLRVMLFDVKKQEYLQRCAALKHATTIPANLNMREAIRQIATSGNPHNPTVQFNQCMFNLGDALSRRKLREVHEWGQKAVAAGNKSGQISLEATGVIGYGSALFQLKEYPDAIRQLERAVQLTSQPAQTGDMSAGGVLVQAHAFRGAVYYRTRSWKDAEIAYRQMGEAATQLQMPVMAMEGWRQAAHACEKHGNRKQAFEYFQHAYKAGLGLDPETRKVTAFPLVAAALHLQAKALKETALQQDIETQLQQILGPHWEQQIRNYKASVPKGNRPMPEMLANH
ncbi:hypothetical protein [Chitinophaga tropicalis]|uniref:Tetratricopeptide repeat protein n=1 Tax=Chitinophaga tropicalis TaxID=2683588 RepID=A0A7K1U5E1_9BACT|nr:hypothetical protein [Chitinophaga tropicalis]MVT09577.1 hypothetical protein [Chitinophaga tropicalis]